MLLCKMGRPKHLRQQMHIYVVNMENWQQSLHPYQRNVSFLYCLGTCEAFYPSQAAEMRKVPSTSPEELSHCTINPLKIVPCHLCWHLFPPSSQISSEACLSRTRQPSERHEHSFQAPWTSCLNPSSIPVVRAPYTSTPHQRSRG